MLDTEIRDHFVQIETTVRRVRRAYRFYGLGVWKEKRDTQWEPINGILIPAEVLKIAAQYCEPADRVALRAHVQMERHFHDPKAERGSGTQEAP